MQTESGLNQHMDEEDDDIYVEVKEPELPVIKAGMWINWYSSHFRKYCYHQIVEVLPEGRFLPFYLTGLTYGFGPDGIDTVRVAHSTDTSGSPPPINQCLPKGGWTLSKFRLRQGRMDNPLVRSGDDDIREQYHKTARHIKALTDAF